VSGDNAPASEIVTSVVFPQLRICDEKIPLHNSKFIIDYQYFFVVLKDINKETYLHLHSNNNE